MRALSLTVLISSVFALEVAAAAKPSWLDSMRQVHARFTGTHGTLAQFGDSITVTLAFWAPLAGTPSNMDQSTSNAHTRVKSYLRPECWRQWKGPQFGNNGSMTIRWAHENADAWLKRLNPEVAVVMFGSNDVDQMDAEEYERGTREVVRRCLTNGTIVLLTTMPPRSGKFEKSRRFAEAARTIATEEKIPLVDYFAEIVKRRPEDWDGSLPQFKNARGDEYQVLTLIARDGVHPSNPSRYANDFSEEALRTNGYSLRNYLTLLVYAEVIDAVLKK